MRYIEQVRTRIADAEIRNGITKAANHSNATGALDRLKLLRDVTEHYDEYALQEGRHSLKYPPIPDQRGITYDLGVNYNQFGQLVLRWRDIEICITDVCHRVLHLTLWTVRAVMGIAPDKPGYGSHLYE